MIRYAYDALGRRTETASGTLTTAYDYDCIGNMVEQTTSGASKIAFSYSYNRNGYITGETRTENGKTTESAYAYDALGQLTDFWQSTGYGESYAYDKAGNMTSRVISGMDGATVALSMRYNEGNQMVSMAHGGDKIAYKYDKNGSLTRKTLTGKAYGRLTDTYAYNTLDLLTAYEGYDGYRQQFTYDANGMRLSKREAGNPNRSTLEELLRGNIAGLPELVQPAQSQTNNNEAGVPAEPEWATTEYLYDLTQAYYQVIQETRTDSRGSATTAYAYGLERIAAYTRDSKTSYVYDGRGSVAQTISAPTAGKAVTSALPDVGVKVQSLVYTAFGEQMGRQKISGFGYNAEAYAAATGMLNLRARQYEPAMNRFSQKDIVRGQAASPLSLNRYVYCVNSPVMHTDPSGMKSSIMEAAIGGITGITKAVTRSAKSVVANAKRSIKTLAFATNKGYAASKNSSDANIRVAYNKATQKIKAKEIAENRRLSVEEKNKIFASECTISAIRIANEYGKESVYALNASETKNIYEYARYSNYRTDKATRKYINSNRESPFKGNIISSKTNNPLCAGYIYNAIALKGTKLSTSKLYEYLKVQRTKDKKVGNTTTPQFAALSGGITRTDTVPKNDGLLAPTVKFVVSLSNNEDMTIKLPGDTDYIVFEGSSKFSYSEQWSILRNAGVLAPNDILYIGEGKHARYIDMHHVVFLDSPETYSGQNSAIINGSISEAYIQPYVDVDEEHRLYFVLLNSNDDMVNQLLKLYQ